MLEGPSCKSVSMHSHSRVSCRHQDPQAHPQRRQSLRVQGNIKGVMRFGRKATVAGKIHAVTTYHLVKACDAFSVFSKNSRDVAMSTEQFDDLPLNWLHFQPRQEQNLGEEMYAHMYL